MLILNVGLYDQIFDDENMRSEASKIHKIFEFRNCYFRMEKNTFSCLREPLGAAQRVS
jgi:hypothetical protein